MKINRVHVCQEVSVQQNTLDLTPQPVLLIFHDREGGDSGS